MDAEPKAEYRRRLHELRAEPKDAERFNDGGAVERARIEIEMLSNQLASAVGLDGRDRPVSAASERARTCGAQPISQRQSSRIW